MSVIEADARVIVYRDPTRPRPNIEGDTGLGFREIMDHTTVSVIENINGSWSATVNLSNANDKYYESKESYDHMIPFIGDTKQKSDYMERLLLNSSVSEINPNRSGYIPFKNNFKNRVLKKEDDYAVYKYNCDFYELQRIWIDFLGIDGIWYAGFTGVISSISKSISAKGHNSSLVLECVDLSRLWELTPVILTRGNTEIAPDITADINEQELRLTWYQTEAADYDQLLLISKCLTIINATFCFQTGVQVLPSNLVSWHDYLYNEAVWYDERSEFKPLSEYPSPVRDFSTVQTLSDFTRLYLTSYVYYDEWLTTYPVFRQLFKSDISLYTHPSKVKVSEVFKQIKNVFGFHLYCDAAGNIVHKYPKYDQLPSIKTKKIDLETTGVSDISGAEYDEGVVKTTYDANGNRSSAKVITDEFYTPVFLDRRTKWHGSNYIIDDKHLDDISVNTTEQSVWTRAVVPSEYRRNISYGPDIDAALFTGYTKITDARVRRLQRRYGVRELQTKPLFRDVLIQLCSEGKINEILTAYALTYLMVSKSMSETATWMLNARPDIYVGNTIMYVEGQMLYYISSITHMFTRGSSFTTRIRGDYGHHPYDPLGAPLLDIVGIESVIKETAVPETVNDIQVGPIEGPEIPDLGGTPVLDDTGTTEPISP